MPRLCCVWVQSFYTHTIYSSSITLMFAELHMFSEMRKRRPCEYLHRLSSARWCIDERPCVFELMHHTAGEKYRNEIQGSLTCVQVVAFPKLLHSNWPTDKRRPHTSVWSSILVHWRPLGGASWQRGEQLLPWDAKCFIKRHTSIRTPSTDDTVRRIY